MTQETLSTANRLFDVMKDCGLIMDILDKADEICIKGIYHGQPIGAMVPQEMVPGLRQLASYHKSKFMDELSKL